MTDDKLLLLFHAYKAKMEGAWGVGEGARYDASAPSPTALNQSLAHLHWMCDEAMGFVEAGRREKAFRWLGFIQGVLWSEGLVTIDDLKEASRP